MAGESLFQFFGLFILRTTLLEASGHFLSTTKSTVPRPSEPAKDGFASPEIWDKHSSLENISRQVELIVFRISDYVVLMNFGELTTTNSTCFRSFQGHFGASQIISRHPPISDMVCKTYPPVPFLVTGASPQLKHRHFAKFKAPLETLGLGDSLGRFISPQIGNENVVKFFRRYVEGQDVEVLMDFSPKVRLFPCSCQAFLQKRYGNLIRAWRQALSQTDSMVSRTGFVRCVGCRFITGRNTLLL